MMDIKLLNLKECIQDLTSSVEWLNKSYSKCSVLSLSENLNEADYESLEALTARFGRTVDLLIHKVWRAIDSYELNDQGFIIDTINRAVKRNIIDTPELARELKELRNLIVHEYKNAKLNVIFLEVIKNTSSLIEICDKTISYTNKYFKQ
jgi:uncharacterized protein YutE (UPF0331/DUF86 family)